MNAPLFVGTRKEMCQYLRCSRTTLWRRMQERPECFRTIGRTVFLITL